jgi:hypothetical protein
MEHQFDIHRIEERLAAIDDATANLFPIPEEYQVKSDHLDNQVIEIQKHCESICRKIYHPNSPFSPDYSLWHKRYQTFKRMIEMQEGTVHNTGLLCKAARKLGIVAPIRWSIPECLHGMAVCRAWKQKLMKYAPSLRFEHLQERLLEAEANRDTEKAKAIRTMMTREESATMWQRLRFTFADNGGQSNAVTRVERMENGVIVEYTEQEEMEQVV